MTKREKEKRVKFFKDSLQKYIDFFNMNDYGYYIYEMEGGDELNDGFVKARCFFRSRLDENNYSRLATFEYNILWLGSDDVDYFEIERTAFHEVLELYFSEFIIMADNNIEHDVLAKEVHRKIRFFENKLFPIIRKMGDK